MQTQTDLFEHYEVLPKEVQEIIGGFEQSDYAACEKFIQKLNEVGYTCDYSLDASPFDLRKI